MKMKHFPQSNPFRRGKAVVIAKGWEGEGKRGFCLGSAVFVEQWWVPVKWEDQDDPDFFKLAGLVAA